MHVPAAIPLNRCKTYGMSLTHLNLLPAVEWVLLGVCMYSVCRAIGTPYNSAAATTYKRTVACCGSMQSLFAALRSTRVALLLDLSAACRH
jgi:hypothetical protein